MKKFIMVVCLFASCAFVHADQPTDAQAGASQETEIIKRAVEDLNLTLYIGSNCPYCRKVMGFLHANNLASLITIKDVWSNRNEMQELTTMTRGKRTVPCLKLDNNGKYMHGSDAIMSTLRKLLAS